MPDRLRRFAIGLAVIAVIGLAWRVAFVAMTEGDDPPGGDGAYYHGQAEALRDGEGFANPFIYEFADVAVDAAHHPPMFPVYLALGSFVGLDDPSHHRLLTALAGAVTVVLVGILARRLAGDRAGLIAAGVAAAYPNLWVNDPLIMSESLYTAFVVLALLTAYRFWDEPSIRNAVFLGGAIALAALTRAEASNLLWFLAFPLVLVVKAIDWRRRLALLAVAGAAYGVVVAPWVVHNLARFEEPVLLSYGAAGVLPQANCDATYDGPLLGYWDGLRCPFPDREMVPEFFEPDADPEVAAEQALDVLGEQDESEIAQIGMRRGLDYINDHRGRAVVVAAARVGRIWGVYRPAQSIELDEQVERRNRPASTVGLILYYELLALGIVGLVVLRRRGIPIIPFVSLAVMATATAAIAIGITRYRIPVDVGLAVLAGVSVDAGLRWVRREPVT